MISSTHRAGLFPMTKSKEDEENNCRIIPYDSPTVDVDFNLFTKIANIEG